MALLGARMNYAVPRILESAGLLERLFTDLCAAKGWPWLLTRLAQAGGPSGFNRLRSRLPHGIPAQKITAFQTFGWSYARRRRAATTPTATTRTFLWANRAFCEKTCRRDWGATRRVFTFNGAGLEILRLAGQRGLATVMEQTIAPKALEQQLLAEERARFPAWEQPEDDAALREFCEREEAEWNLAETIVCGSDFVRAGIRQCGGPDERCVVAAYGIDPLGPVRQRGEIADRDHPLRVLTVGSVGLRKGHPYVIEAAQRLAGRAEFRVVGPLGIGGAALESLRAATSVWGSLPRSELAAHFDWADVFLLPSICEGSATVTYEALSQGLPVIATPNAGSVVRSGEDGYIVPLRDSATIVDRLAELHENRELLARLSQAAMARREELSVAGYTRRLLAALTSPRMASASAPRSGETTATW